MTQKAVKQCFLSVLVVGALSLVFALLIPSEAESAVFMGFSRQRLLLVGIQFFLLLVLTLLFILYTRNPAGTLFFKTSPFLKNPANYALTRNTLLGLSIFLGFTFFYVSVFVPQALSAIIGWLAYTSWLVYAVFVRGNKPPRGSELTTERTLFPAWKNLSPGQKKIFCALIFMGAVYFCVFIPVNLKFSATPAELIGDEAYQYSVVAKMLSPQESVRFAFYRLFIYGEYVYGFPFYGLSAILLVPLKAIYGAAFSEHSQLNLLILRQLVCVLPTILAALILTYLATRFKKWWSAAGLFVILLTLPGVINFNTRFWHPDSLNLLFIALTLFFLERDGLEFGGNFYMAAITCGLSIATRLFGLFFFLAIAFLLVAGLVKKILTLRKAAMAGILFCLVMVGTILVSNPYLFKPGELGAATKILQKQGAQVTQGIDEPDPNNIYRTGLDAWWPFINLYYGSGLTLGFLTFSALAGLFGGTRKHYSRILFAWLVVVGSYLVFFTKVKSFWYLLPFLLPLYSSFFVLTDNFFERTGLGDHKANFRVDMLLTILVMVVGTLQLFQNIQWILFKTYL